MASCISKQKNEQQLINEQRKQISKQIDRCINEESKKKQSSLKLLLLGTGESGKTTVIKQMKIIHIDGYSESERAEFIPNIKRNVRDAILAIVVAMKTLDIKPKEFDIDAEIKELRKAFQLGFVYDDTFFDRVTGLWDDDAVQYCYTRSNEYQIIDSAQYFLDRIDEIRQTNYSPTLQDILRCRKMTNGISEINFEVKESKRHKVHFKVFDVGGQQGERKRWIQLFGDVTAILFIADCSSFDQTLREDQIKNRLIDSLEVFSQAWTNRYLQNVPILVFLNKIDLLDTKMHSGHSLNHLFSGLYNPIHRNKNDVPSTNIQSVVNSDKDEENTCIDMHTNPKSQLENIAVPNSRNRNLLNRATRRSSHNDTIDLENSPNLIRKSFIKEPVSSISHEVTLSASTTPCDSLHPECHSSARKLSYHVLHSYYTPTGTNNSRRPSKSCNFEFVSQVVQEYPWWDFEPTNEERREFVQSFPIENLEISSKRKKGHHMNRRKSVDHEKSIHPNTIRTACYIKNLFIQIIRCNTKLYNPKTGRKRKFLFYYTCAVNTNNIEKVLDGCRSFLIQEHLERSGIL